MTAVTEQKPHLTFLTEEAREAELNRWRELLEAKRRRLYGIVRNSQPWERESLKNELRQDMQRYRKQIEEIAGAKIQGFKDEQKELQEGA